jgi:hypothetical protein
MAHQFPANDTTCYHVRDPAECNEVFKSFFTLTSYCQWDTSLKYCSYRPLSTRQSFTDRGLILIVLTAAFIIAPLQAFVDLLFSQLLVDIEVPSIDTLHLLQQADAHEHEDDVKRQNEKVDERTTSERRWNVKKTEIIPHSDISSISGSKQFDEFLILEQRRYLKNELKSINEFLFKDDWEIETVPSDDEHENQENNGNQLHPLQTQSYKTFNIVSNINI